MTQGERVKELRQYLGLTLEKFGEKLGVQKSAISKIERGDCNLTEANIKLICREFNINEEWLRTGSGDMKISVEDEAVAAVSELVEKNNPLYDLIKGIMISYQKLDEPSRQIIDQFILDAIPSTMKAPTDPYTEAPKKPEELEHTYPPLNMNDEEAV